MRKKYLSALLFGALVMASTATFTSCKDYDDDIDQVNTNVNAVKSDLSSKMDAVNTSISGLTSAQSEIKGSLSAVNKQIETLTANGAKAVAELKAELQKADADQKAALEAKIAELNTQLEEQVDALAKQAALLSAQDEQITAALADLEAVKAQIVTVSTALEEKIAQNVTDIETLNEITAALSATVDANMAEVVGKIAAMETALTSHQVAIESIRVTLDGIDGQIAAIKALAGDNTAAIETLKADIETLKKEMEEKIVASHDAIRAEISKVDSDLNARIDKLTETVLAEQVSMMEKLANQTAALELQKTALEEYKAEMEAADLDRDGKIGANAETIAANKEAADKAIADLNTLLETEVKGLNDKIDALDERIKALEAGVSEADWQTIKKEIEDANKEVTTAYEKADKALEEKIDQLEKDLKKTFGDDLNTLKGTVNSLITNVSFVLQSTTTAPVITFTNVIENETKFGYDVNGNLLSSAITFQKNRQLPLAQKFNVRVSPASAVLDPSQISFVNSKGEVMPNVSVTKVVRYEETNEGYLTRAASAPTGIWVVTVQLNNYDENAFNAATKTNGAYIAYAMSVSNAIKTEENTPRNVTTSFDMKFQYKKYKQQNQLWFNVDGKPVSKLKNRADYNSSVPGEYTWKKTADDGSALDPVPAYVKEAINKTNGNGQNTVLQGAANSQGTDARFGSGDYFSATQGVPFTVSLTTGDAASTQPTDMAAPKAVKAIYVTLDKQFAVESTPSEWEAWSTAYNYTGLNQVVEGTSTQITITSPNAISDIIGFRVYAVNFDGTLVDPDGKAFYVYVGNASTEASATVSFAPTTYTAQFAPVKSGTAALSTANWASADAATLLKIYDSADADKNNIATSLGLDLNNFYMTKNDGSNATALSAVAAIPNAQTLAQYTKVQIQNADMMKLKDGKTYIAEIQLTKNIITGSGNVTSVVQTITVQFSKTLPTFPINRVYPFTNVLVNNTLKVYPKKIVSGQALYDIDNVWHGVDAHTEFVQTDVTETNRQTVFYERTNTTPESSITDNTPAFKVDKDIMRTNHAKYGKAFPMAVKYDFGYLSTDNADGDHDDSKFMTDGTTFNVVFGNYLDDCTYAWNGAAPVLAYPGVKDQNSYIDASKLKVTDWYQRGVNLWIRNGNGLSTTTLANGYAANIKIDLLTGPGFTTENEYYKAEAVLVSRRDASGNDTSYIAIKLTSKVNASQGSPVPTKIRLTITDIYGGQIVKTFDPFTMTFQQQ